ncbi:MAG TPA: hypothetical protein VLG15_13175 [Thermoanaerobaculia bacterium]|jgi:hypothetical protein|nr:hypothetical protein [Thermoanaerobaculia bacterium]
MPAGDSVAPRVRRSAPGGLLLILAVSMIATVSPAEIARRWEMFTRSVAGGTIAPGAGSGFWFDPAYAAFLEAVRARTPRDATIVVIVPQYPDVYTYEAAYQLAPRRVIPPDRESEGTFVAAYRYQYRDVLNPDVIRIPNGALFLRR